MLFHLQTLVTGIAAPSGLLTPLFLKNCVSSTLRVVVLERFILRLERCYWELCHIVEDLDEIRV